MTDSRPDIQSILAALASQRPPTGTPTQTPPGAPSQAYPPPPASTQPAAAYQQPPMNPGGYGAPGYNGLPAPSSSGNLDLSSIRPVNSGTLSITDAIAQAKAYAAEKGVTSYDRPLVYASENRGPDRGYNRSRSRSPARDEFRDGVNPYRDERRGGDRGAHSRGYDRDRSYSPGPRGRNFSPREGNGRERSPLRGGDDNSETIQIESSLVGLIIGRQGENLRRIEADSNCRVQFLAPTDGGPGPYRQCKISGPRHRRGEVKDAINRIIEDSGMGALNRPEKPRDPNKGGATALREGEDHMQIMVPDRTVGLIIGRGGETIRDLQERSGCHINIVGESKSVNGLRPVNLIGTREAAARAKDFIMEIVDSDSRGDAPPPVKKLGGGGSAPPARHDGPQQRDMGGSGGPDKINDAVYVPSDAVGMIIGKGGETIREMQNTTGCKINVAQSSGPGETQREIALIGSRDSIARAKQAIDEKVDAVRQKGSGPRGGGGGGRGHQDLDRPSYSQQQTPSAPTNQPPQQAPADGSDPYAQYGGYQNYVALWYQSLVFQQQQGGQGAPPAGAPAPGA
ncbi:hypothetical protein EDB82DRAFT_427833 [Fusarium venenatum]|uniref:uncharacterized protein n=1 Tax=Fusarium venenatum TaxID=56646 RepID=UPI001DB892BF|nr:hypothetical protein EDB82DRAFT_427833 [Fusarium venenatum]